MEIDREFNPHQWEVESSDESSLEDNPIIIIERNRLEWPGYDNNAEYLLESCMDGLILLSDRADIGKINGSTAIFKFPTVFDKSLSAFKGLHNYLGVETKHVYEFNLMTCGSFSLAALVITGTIPMRSRPRYNLMVISYHEAIRRSILALSQNAASKREMLLRMDKQMVIFESDWAEIATYLPGQLNQISQEDEHRNHIPQGSVFRWCIKQLGQNKRRVVNLDDFASQDLPFNVAINLTGNYCASIHCAYDFSVPDCILWWKPSAIQHEWGNIMPKKVYRTGIIPGLGNIAFELNEINNGISFIQYYTRIYNQIHKDATHILMRPFIAKELSCLLTSSLKQTPLPKETIKTKLVTQGGLETVLDGITNVSRGTYCARIEMVHSTTNQYATAGELVNASFEYCDRYVQNNPRFRIELAHAMPSDVYLERLHGWIPYFRIALQGLSNKIMALRNMTSMYLIPPEQNIRSDEIQLAYVVENILHLLVTGTVHKGFHSSIITHLGLTSGYLAAPQNLQLDEWPFQNLIRKSDGTMRFEESAQIHIVMNHIFPPQLTDNISRFIHLRGVYEGIDRRDRTRIKEAARNIAEEVLEIIILHQMRLTSIAIQTPIQLSFLYNEPFIKTRSIVYLRSGEFIEKLVNPRDLGSFPQHSSTVFAVMDWVRQNINIPGTDNFTTILAGLIDERILADQYPLRFTFGPNIEYFVMVEAMSHPISESIKKIWKRLFYKILKNRVNRSRLLAQDMFNIYSAWAQNHTVTRLTSIIVGFQLMIDTGTIPDSHRMNEELKKAIIAANTRYSFTEREGHPEDPSLNEQSSVSSSDQPLQNRLEKRLNRKRNLQSMLTISDLISEGSSASNRLSSQRSISPGRIQASAVDIESSESISDITNTGSSASNRLASHRSVSSVSSRPLRFNIALSEPISDFTQTSLSSSNRLASHRSVSSVSSWPLGSNIALSEPISDFTQTSLSSSNRLASHNSVSSVSYRPRGVNSALSEPISDITQTSSSNRPAGSASSVYFRPCGVNIESSEPISDFTPTISNPSSRPASHRSIVAVPRVFSTMERKSLDSPILPESVLDENRSRRLSPHQIRQKLSYQMKQYLKSKEIEDENTERGRGGSPEPQNISPIVRRCEKDE